jgi:hypothetical protein
MSRSTSRHRQRKAAPVRRKKVSRSRSRVAQARRKKVGRSRSRSCSQRARSLSKSTHRPNWRRDAYNPRAHVNIYYPEAYEAECRDAMRYKYRLIGSRAEIVDDVTRRLLYQTKGLLKKADIMSELREQIYRRRDER